MEFIVKVVYKAVYTAVVDCDDSEKALDIAREQAEEADTSEFAILDEQDAQIITSRD